MTPKIKPAINMYYWEVLQDMINIIQSSTAGKRQWTKCFVTGYCDYSISAKSTFPDWIKFWYVSTPIKKRFKYLDTRFKPYEDGYFNGNTKEILAILENYKNGYESKSPRVRQAFSLALHGYLSEIKDWEHLNNQQYYSDDLFNEIPF